MERIRKEDVVALVKGLCGVLSKDPKISYEIPQS